MSKFTTILFDLDDTLFDFSACWEKGMQQTISTHALTAELDQEKFLEALRRHGDDLWVDVIAKRYDFTQYRRLRFQRAMADCNRQIEAGQVDDFQRAYQAACLDAIQPDATVQSTIARLAEEHTLGIVTNGPVDMAFIKLERLGLSAHFPRERVFLSEIIGHHKPDLRIYEHVREKLGVESKQVLFVGDTWEADVAGAMDAGFSAVWINPRGKKPTSKHQPLAVIERLDQLLAIL
ncbi:HAD family hydrolase [Brevibacillus formosus]|uniref:Haloacid dehalogenase n=1 Tax=Brevibacillus formosus TaxID=54913 RepID=A0A837KHJ8_9BACL|nr:HAD family hydrolase [Brevibacillus formosus]KLH96635.1 haloacid dehalogenase [Brevibacillus formosus]MED1960220.1 HAD family hydrolase [Brevibacillus formosus]PSJ99378.1 HAD family hydrolase [Brevibacillus formosus]GED59666.1 haloacid dehalogenase [Brevibacillus formosus]